MGTLIRSATIAEGLQGSVTIGTREGNGHVPQMMLWRLRGEGEGEGEGGGGVVVTQIHGLMIALISMCHFTVTNCQPIVTTPENTIR